MPYPEFKSMIEFYGDPDGFLNSEPAAVDVEAEIDLFYQSRQKLIDKH